MRQHAITVCGLIRIMEWCHFWYIVEEESSMRIVQLSGPQGRRLGMVEDDDSIRLLRTHASVVHLAESALAASSTLTRTVEQILDTTLLDYAPTYAGPPECR